MQTLSESATAPPSPHCGVTVMVVDDNPANLTLMEEMLLPRGYEVRSFPRGRLALAAAAENPPDLVLLDINMPEMTGYEVCEKLKADPRLCGIPVIFLSALGAPEDRILGFKAGAIDYVTKPFQFEEVRARVDAQARLWRLQRKVEADNLHLRELVRLQVKKTADAQMETIFALAKLAEARDDETGMHLERVQSFCGLLAAGLNQQPRYRANIYHASPLHDIGKVAIPDRILLKPGPLTPEEFAVMKTHTILGSQTLTTVHNRYPDNEFIAMGIEIARSHHERWDGLGYPDGRSGEEIPLSARILAVADSYDAIRARRRYKAAVTHEKACNILLAESGKQFDPAVTAVFIQLQDSFREVWESMTAQSLLALDKQVGNIFQQVPASSLCPSVLQ